jgi:hypothetical protein
LTTASNNPADLRPSRKGGRHGSAGLLAALLSLSDPGAAGSSQRVRPAAAAALPDTLTPYGNAASSDVRAVADWARSGDARRLPFVIVDKAAARVFVFDRSGRLLGTGAALLGLARGDDSAPGIGQKRLASITPDQRTTPAGRFEASLGRDFEQDILWIDYEAALSLHRVVVGRAKDHRARRLATPSPRDNRISYGCINVAAAFYDKVVAPAFADTVGIVYILPETRPLRAVFAIPADRG